MFPKVAQKVNIYLGNSSEKYVAKNFLKSPNLVTLDFYYTFSFREAYGSYFASSAQRSAQRFGDSFKRISPSLEGGEGDDLDIFDQVHWSQCDQMARLFIQNLAIYTNANLPSSI